MYSRKLDLQLHAGRQRVRHRERRGCRGARVPWYGTQASQVGEYVRAFFGARIARASMNGLMIISGAFGVFRRDLVLAVGGLSKATLGEDMELAMHLHERLRPTQPETRVAFAPDANCWTEVPPGPVRCADSASAGTSASSTTFTCTKDDRAPPLRRGRRARDPLQHPLRGDRTAAAGGGSHHRLRPTPLRSDHVALRDCVPSRDIPDRSAADRRRDLGRGRRLRPLRRPRPRDDRLLGPCSRSSGFDP
jgi:Glycosyl transferase family group 2